MAILGAHHINVKSSKYEEMKAFYTETLGFPIAGQIPGTQVVFIDIGGTTIELGPTDVAQDTPDRKTGFIHLAFEVDDVDATYRELAAKGVEFFIEPRDAISDIRMAFFRDPDGNPLELFKSPNLSWK
ncbi:MAG: VOC family protein [Anaerolineae bacterium]|nr:VOC family protein [Anaerolineae bacterium]